MSYSHLFGQTFFFSISFTRPFTHLYDSIQCDCAGWRYLLIRNLNMVQSQLRCLRVHQEKIKSKTSCQAYFHLFTIHLLNCLINLHSFWILIVYWQQSLAVFLVYCFSSFILLNNRKLADWYLQVDRKRKSQKIKTSNSKSLTRWFYHLEFDS